MTTEKKDNQTFYAIIKQLYTLNLDPDTFHQLTETVSMAIIEKEKKEFQRLIGLIKTNEEKERKKLFEQLFAEQIDPSLKKEAEEYLEVNGTKFRSGKIELNGSKFNGKIEEGKEYFVNW